MKSAADLIVNYTAGLDPAAIAAKFTAKSGTMIAGFTTAATTTQNLNLQMLAIMNAQGISTSQRPKHYNFGREILHLVNIGVTDPELTNQVINQLQPKYEDQGCLTANLILIAALLNVVIPP
jgi:hypothetical protein